MMMGSDVVCAPSVFPGLITDGPFPFGSFTDFSITLKNCSHLSFDSATTKRIILVRSCTKIDMILFDEKFGYCSNLKNRL